MPSAAQADAVWSAAGAAPGTAELRFRLDCRRFRSRAASVGEIAALQRRWREFRIAPSSCERDDATLPKIWTLSSVSNSPNENRGGFNESARHRQQIFSRQAN
jgi:hypothetical protein